MAAETLHRVFQARQHVPPAPLRIARRAAIAELLEIVVELRGQLQQGFGRHVGLGRRAVFHRRQERGNDVVILEHHRRPASIQAERFVGFDQRRAEHDGHPVGMPPYEALPAVRKIGDAGKDFALSGNFTAIQQSH